MSSLIDKVVSGDDFRHFIKVAEFVLARVRPSPRQEFDSNYTNTLVLLIYDGVKSHLKDWSEALVHVCWKVMLQIRMKRVPPSYVDFFKILPGNEVEMHFRKV